MVKVISFKVTPEYQEKLKNHSDTLGLSVSAFIRYAVDEKLPSVQQSNTEGNTTVGQSNTEVEPNTTDIINQQIDTKDQQISEKDNQISEKDKQIDHLTQIVAMQQQSIQSITSQNQLLLETSQQKKPSFWQRLIGQKI
jgi:uncharacterized protein (DUF3084 family)